MFDKLQAEKERRKIDFLASNRVPWSRAEWRWFNELQKGLTDKPA
tara:strand:- start:827 stop:961 length:135 start_codon:yes stop_codon:yes gene_type:complete